MNPVYQKRINSAIDYIQEHIDQELSLEKIARAACFSKFHFHRLFKAIVSETVTAYVKRTRLEKSASMLVKTSFSVTEIAYKLGFSSPANYTRDFRNFFSTNPTAYRDNFKYSKIRKAGSWKKEYITAQDKVLWDALEGKVKICRLPPYHVVYLRSMTGYNEKVHSLWEKLLKTAESYGLINENSLRISILYDDPGITGPERCCYDACLSTGSAPENPGSLGVRHLEGGTFAVLPFFDHPSRLEKYYDYIYGTFLANSEYEAADCYGFQIHYPEKSVRDKDIFAFDICTPIKPL